MFAQGFVQEKEGHAMLIVNKQNANVTVAMTGLTGGKMYVVDEQSGFGPARTVEVTHDHFDLTAFAVAVLIPFV